MLKQVNHHHGNTNLIPKFQSMTRTKLYILVMEGMRKRRGWRVQSYIYRYDYKSFTTIKWCVALFSHTHKVCCYNDKFLYFGPYDIVNTISSNVLFALEHVNIELLFTWNWLSFFCLSNVSNKPVNRENTSIWSVKGWQIEGLYDVCNNGVTYLTWSW